MVQGRFGYWTCLTRIDRPYAALPAIPDAEVSKETIWPASILSVQGPANCWGENDARLTGA